MKQIYRYLVTYKTYEKRLSDPVTRTLIHTSKYSLEPDGFGDWALTLEIHEHIDKGNVDHKNWELHHLVSIVEKHAYNYKVTITLYKLDAEEAEVIEYPLNSDIELALFNFYLHGHGKLEIHTTGRTVDVNDYVQVHMKMTGE